MKKYQIEALTNYYIGLLMQATAVIGSDRIRSDLNSIDKGSDQIGSNEGEKMLSVANKTVVDMSTLPDWKRWLFDFCAREFIDISGKDVDKLERNIVYVMQNIDSIRSPRQYVKKIISGCPDKRVDVGFRPSSDKSLLPVEDAPVTEILGIPIDEVDEAAARISAVNYSDLLSVIPSFSVFLFRNFDAVMKDTAKLRTLAAYGLQKGVL